MPLGMFSGRVGGGGTATGTEPHRGQGAFGLVPGNVNVPENIWSQVSRNLPDFGNLTGGTSSVIGSELAGTVSPQTQRALQTAAAQFGVSSGMPGSGLAANNYFGNIAGYSENRQRQGLQDYLATLSGVGATQTNPALAYEVANRNAMYAAAPDPQAAAERMLAEYMMKFNMAKNAGSGGFSRSTGGPARGPQWASVSGMPNLGVPGPPATFNRATGDFGPNQVLYGPGGGPNAEFIDASKYPVGTRFDPTGTGGFSANYPVGATPTGQLIYGGRQPTPFMFGGQEFGTINPGYYYRGESGGESPYYSPGGGPGGYGAETEDWSIPNT